MSNQVSTIGSSSKVCSLCLSSATIKYYGQPGYQQPKIYAIYHCEQCNTSWAEPHFVDDQLYNMIYSRSSLIPSYRRYDDYAREVCKQRDPFSYLAHSEDMYWGVYQFISKQDPSILSVLDIGSGLGYITYALNQRGIKTKGIDISENATIKAQQSYGDYFICGNIYEYAQISNEQYTLIIMCEVIEHIEDIVFFLQTADVLLAPGGSLVITTPNKSLYPSSLIWHTAPPPVHLWWLSEDSFIALASNMGYTSQFIDYSEFNKINGKTVIPNHKPNFPTRSHVLDRKGKLYIQPGFKNSIKFFLRKIIRDTFIQRIKAAIFSTSKTINDHQSHRRGTLCVVLTKPT